MNTKVSMCKNCPFLSHDPRSGPSMCSHPHDPFRIKKGYSRLLEDLNEVPNWCQLRIEKYVETKEVSLSNKVKKL